MVSEKFNMVVGAIIFVSLASIIIVLFSSAQQNLDTDIITGLRSRVITNVTNAEDHTGQNSAAGRIVNGTPVMIRNTPSFSCDNFHISENTTGTGAQDRLLSLTTGGGVTAGTTEVLCVGSNNFVFNSSDAYKNLEAGTVILLLAGNESNSSALLGRGFPFNISYTAKVYGASWNTTKELQQGYLEGGDIQAQYFTLIILALVIGVAGAILGVRFFGKGEGAPSGGFGGGTLGDGKFMDSFER